MKCRECKQGDMVDKIQNYRYDECGLSHVVLSEIKVRCCPFCDARLVSIPRMSELHREIAVRLVQKRGGLTGQEIRFLRKSLGWSGTDFARKFHVEKATVSRWENSKLNLSAGNELLLRALVAQGNRIEDYVQTMDAIDLKPGKSAMIQFRVDNSGWCVAA